MSLGYYPSCLGKDGFPKSMAISVNEIVCHYIPDNNVLMDGDIVKVDLVMYVRGWHGDTCRTFTCGNVDEKGKKLIATTKEAMEEAIKICKPGVDYSEIGRVIEEIATRGGFDVYFRVYHFTSSVRDYCGHGIGRYMHMLPYILHFKNKWGGKMVKSTLWV